MHTMKFHVKKGDTVMILAGKDKTKTGKIMNILSNKNKVLVEGINIVKRHVRARGSEAGGVIEKEAPLHISNVQLFCSKCTKPVRTRIKVLESGDKQRICVKCATSLDN